MKFKTPPIEISAEHPFASDPFHRKPFTKLLNNAIESIDDSLVISIDSSWGHGKTTFAKQWVQSLKNDGKKVILFNAFQHDLDEDPFLSFSGEIYAFIKDHFKDQFKEERKSFLENSGNLLSVLATSALKTGLNAATAGVINDKACNNIMKAANAEIASITGRMCEEKIENHTQKKKLFDAFHENLKKLAELVRNEQDFPLTIIIDELDRCRPDFALQLLERIKHYFNVDNVTFVLLICEKQFLNHVTSTYGLNKNIESYLHKFADLFLTLPNGRPFDSGESYLKYMEETSDRMGLQKTQITYTCGYLAASNQCSMRQCNQMLSIIALYSNLFPRSLDIETMAILIFLKVTHIDIIEKLAANNFKINYLESLEMNSTYLEDTKKHLELMMMDQSQYKSKHMFGSGVISHKDFRHSITHFAQILLNAR